MLEGVLEGIVPQNVRSAATSSSIVVEVRLKNGPARASAGEMVDMAASAALSICAQLALRGLISPSGAATGRGRRAPAG